MNAIVKNVLNLNKHYYKNLNKNHDGVSSSAFVPF